MTDEVGAQVVEAPLRPQRVEQPAEVAGRRGEVRLRDVDRVQPHDRIQLEGPGREVLAHDLAMDLALGRDVDDGVAEQLGRARQPPVVGEAVLGAVGRLDLAGRGEVLRART